MSKQIIFNPIDNEPKNSRVCAKVGKSRKDKFMRKCKEMGLSETQFIEKICDCAIIFLDNNTKLAVDMIMKEARASK